MFFAMENRISAWALLLVVWSSVAAINVDIPENLYEFVSGDNITLPCRFETYTTNDTPVVISWSVKDSDSNAKQTVILSYYHPPQITDIKSQYEGRVSLDVDVAKGRANLELSSITTADNKRFYCRVQIPGDNEGNPVDSTSLVVLVAPSPPICKIQEEVEFGKNINLTCYSEEGNPPPNYSWESHDVRSMPRMPDPTTTEKEGILSLYNISNETSGYYICTSTNKIGSATCNITLTVMPPKLLG